MPEELPEDVAAFLMRHIDSVPQLEGLLLLWESAGQPWSGEELAARLYLRGESVQPLLAGLVRRRLIEPAADGFVFPADSPQAGLVARVAAAYRANLIQAAGLIHSKASSAVREFAQAFRIKKES
ncbi:MAG TPA: hypothetical protein VFA75_05725 [Nevskia sp.]|jgi:hypothetical protein|nr:hypothetical protein [Nevskia sp.]